MKPGESYPSITTDGVFTPQPVFEIQDIETRLQRDNAFFEHTTNYHTQEAVRNGRRNITIPELQATNGLLTAFANDRRLNLELNGHPGYGSYSAFSPLQELSDGIVRTTHLAVSEPYDAYSFGDGSGNQYVCFALVGPGTDGDMHTVIARATRRPGVPANQPITRDELRLAVPLAFVAQREHNRNIIVCNVTCAPPNPEFPASRPTVNLTHLTKENNVRFITTELPRVIAAMPLHAQ